MNASTLAQTAAGRGNRGFSLIELLITSALLIVLASMMLSKGSKSFQQRQKVVCREQLLTLHVGLQLYATEHEGRYPVVTEANSSESPLALLLPKYVSTTQPFICPGTKRDAIPEGRKLTDYSISYAYYMGRTRMEGAMPLLTDAQINPDDKKARDPIFSSDGKGRGNNHDKYGGNVLFADGRAEEMRAKTSIDLSAGNGVRLLNPKP